MITQTAIQLIVNNLAAMRGTRMVFRNLDVTAKAGDAYAIIGPNGAGKTTFLRCVAGLLAPASGSVTLTGGDEERSVGEQCHYIGHLNGIKPALSVRENIEFYYHFLGGSGDIGIALERLALTELEDIPAAYLSAGQKRRLGLARLLCAHRPLWLLDEPAVSLDKASQEVLAQIVSDHLRGGGIALAVTHTPLGWESAQTLDFGQLVQDQDDVVESAL
jgi:heme exporter protein A